LRGVFTICVTRMHAKAKSLTVGLDQFHRCFSPKRKTAQNERLVYFRINNLPSEPLRIERFGFVPVRMAGATAPAGVPAARATRGSNLFLI